MFTMKNTFLIVYTNTAATHLLEKEKEYFNSNIFKKSQSCIQCKLFGYTLIQLNCFLFCWPDNILSLPTQMKPVLDVVILPFQLSEYFKSQSDMGDIKRQFKMCTGFEVFFYYSN